jgi:transcriptional regulator with XRE-family HTH domain
MSVAETIFKNRRKLLLTQKQFAEKIGVAEVSIRKWEHGICEPRLKVIRIMAAFFGMSLADFFGPCDIPDSSLRCIR